MSRGEGVWFNTLVFPSQFYFGMAFSTSCPPMLVCCLQPLSAFLDLDMAFFCEGSLLLL